MSHSCVQIYIHLIFATKNRLPIIPLEIEERLFFYLGGIAKKRETPILITNGTQDHIHILLKLHPSIPLSTLVKELKAYSTSWLKKQDIHDFAWQEGYGAFSCSITHIEPLIKYIKNQKENHKKISFDNEIDTLNNVWGVKWMRD